MSDKPKPERDKPDPTGSKPEKFYIDDKGVLHAPACPATKAAWAGQKTLGCEALVPGALASGPAQVATEAYREGYDRIFGTKPTLGQA